jgi:hypothetical protein
MFFAPCGMLAMDSEQFKGEAIADIDETVQEYEGLVK